MYVPPLKVIRASPEGTNQSREAPVPIIFKSGISVFILHSELAFSRTVSTPHSLPNHYPLTILLPQPLPRAQTGLQATSTGTEEETSSHAHPTSASSNPLAALPTGGIMGPPTAHGLRIIISPLQARSEGARQFPGASLRYLPPTQSGYLSREVLGEGELTWRKRCKDLKGIMSQRRI